MDTMVSVKDYSGDAIMKKRKTRGMNATSLASEVRITVEELHDIEAGRSSPSLQTLVAIATVLHLPVSEILPVLSEAVSDDIKALLRLRHQRPEIIQMMALPELSDVQIIAAFHASCYVKN